MTISVAYSGMNFADILARRGAPGYADSWPHLPGLEVSGTVAALGPGVGDLAVGDRVIAFLPAAGGHAEVVAAEAALCVPAPPLSSAAAATLPLTWVTALGLVRRAQVGDQETVLVTSAGGGVAQAVAEILRRRAGVILIGGVGSEAKLAATRSAGYQTLVRTDDLAAEMFDLTDGRGADVVLESVGGPVMAAGLELLAPGGRLVSYGVAAGAPDPPGPPLIQLRRLNQSISGFSALGYARREPTRFAGLMRSVVELVKDGLRIPEPDIAELEEVAVIQQTVESGQATGKTVVTPRSPGAGTGDVDDQARTGRIRQQPPGRVR